MAVFFSKTSVVSRDGTIVKNEKFFPRGREPALKSGPRANFGRATTFMTARFKYAGGRR
jgi:hypothetical protein